MRILSLLFLKKKTYLTKKNITRIFLILSLGIMGFVIFNQLLIFSTPTIENNAKQNLYVSHPPGSYNDPFVLTINISNLGNGQVVRYTLDGSTPDFDSSEYVEGINIDTSKAVNISIFENEEKVGDTASLVYILNEHTFPIVSLVTEPENLWDPVTGIYVPGSKVDRSDPYSYNFNKRGEEWRRPAKFIYFNEEKNKDIEMKAEIRVSGGATRFHPQKSLRICAKREFGNKYIDYAFFDDPNNTKHKCVILRNSGNDWDRTLFRDILAQSLIYDTDVDTQMHKPVVVYLNGEYWGIHNIREFYDVNYINHNYGAKSVTVVIVEPDRKKQGYPVLREGVSGDEKYYLELLENAHNYDYLAQNIDPENYIDYFLINVFVANDDWPENNIRAWKFKSDMFEHELFQPLDGKWRWVLFDLDSSFFLFKSSKYDYNTLAFATAETIEGEEWPSMIIRTLLENEDFKNRFINRYADLLNTNFSSENILKTINYLENLYEPEIPMHTQRWGGEKDKGNKPAFEDINVWKENVQILKDFAKYRQYYARDHVVKKFGLSGTSKLILKSFDRNAGYVRINTIDTKENIRNEELIYFNDIPIEIEAVPYFGWKFTGWGNSDLEKSKKTTIVLAQDTELAPQFELTILGKLLQFL